VTCRGSSFTGLLQAASNTMADAPYDRRRVQRSRVRFISNALIRTDDITM
jgi:hypothetical protein